MLRRRVPTSEVVPDDESMSLLLYTSKHIINQLVPKPVYVAFFIQVWMLMMMMMMLFQMKCK